jgi:transcriptional regulator with XRE-family HTH domain
VGASDFGDSPVSLRRPSCRALCFWLASRLSSSECGSFCGRSLVTHVQARSAPAERDADGELASVGKKRAVEREPQGLVNRPKRAEDNDHERMSALLRRCRTRIAPGRASLGRYLRLPCRIGKAVTQEEVAEAVGISRQWYARLESERPVRVSSSVLARIADALMMSPAERTALFRLALPELRLASPTSTSREILNAFGSLRRLMRRLWAATSEAEALTVIREQALTQLGADAMLTRTRVAEGRWDQAASGARDGDERGQQCLGLIRRHWDAATVDDMHIYSFIWRPGEVVTRPERDARWPVLAAKVREALNGPDFADATWAMANVQTQHGFVARLMAVHATRHEFSETERAMLGTLSDLASVALSGYA